MPKPSFLLALLLLSCTSEPVPRDTEAADSANAVIADPGPSLSDPNGAADAGNMSAEAPLDPPAPGEPGGLPDDRRPVSEAPFAATSAQGAANLVQTYYALIGQRRYEDAWRLWSGGGEASGMDAGTFAAGFAQYREYHAQIGAPGEIEGAAGSLFVEVPVQVYGRLKNGTPFNMLGSVTLRRVNDVPGSSAEQRQWHIYRNEVKPAP
jgi:hypothetical protein